MDFRVTLTPNAAPCDHVQVTVTRVSDGAERSYTTTRAALADMARDISEAEIVTVLKSAVAETWIHTAGTQAQKKAAVEAKTYRVY